MNMANNDVTVAWRWLPAAFVVVKLVLFMTISYGVILGLFLSLTIGMRRGIFLDIESALAFGCVCGGSFSLVHILRVRHLAGRLNGEALGLTHHRSFDLALAYDAAYNSCIRAILSVTNASLQLKDRQAGLIVARTGFAFFGQEIKVSISCDMDHTHVSLFIRPKVNIAMIDFGTGLETIGRIEEYLLAL